MRTQLVLAALLAAAVATAASPAPIAGGPPAVFRRSCADCAEWEFCEFAHPGAPADRVACIAAPHADHALYRRYASDTSCGANRLCCQPTGQQTHAGATSLEACSQACAGRTGCTHYAFTAANSCRTMTGCSTWGTETGTTLFAVVGSACPPSQCSD